MGTPLYVLETALNYDTGPKTYYVELALRDTADRFGQSLATSATIIVTVEDLPDLDPIWVQPCYPQAIDEEIPLG